MWFCLICVREINNINTATVINQLLQ